jgi:hypothetical protein
MQLVNASKVRMFGFGILLLAAAGAFAKDGRDFAGFYNLSHISDTGNAVQVTLRVELFNYSSGDANHAVVSLYETGAGATVHGSFAAIKVFHDKQRVQLAQQFTVPKREYERWERGSNPVLVVDYADKDGKRMHRSVQLIRHPAPRED